MPIAAARCDNDPVWTLAMDVDGAIETPVPIAAARCDNDPVWTLAMDVLESG